MNVDDILAKASFYTDNDPYVLLKLPAAAITAAAGVLAEISEPFGALIIDKDEVTLIIPQDTVPDFVNRLPGHEISAEPFRLITLDVVWGLDAVGVMAKLSATLAAAGVSVFAYAAYSRDHLLVPAKQFDQAMAALAKLKG